MGVYEDSADIQKKNTNKQMSHMSMNKLILKLRYQLFNNIVLSYINCRNVHCNILWPSECQINWKSNVHLTCSPNFWTVHECMHELFMNAHMNNQNLKNRRLMNIHEFWQKVLERDWTYHLRLWFIIRAGYFLIIMNDWVLFGQNL